MPADHSTPEGRRCPECTWKLSPTGVCWTTWCKNRGAYIREDNTVSRGEIVPAPAPVGGDEDDGTPLCTAGPDGGPCILCRPATPTSAEGGEGGEALTCPHCGGALQGRRFLGGHPSEVEDMCSVCHAFVPIGAAATNRYMDERAARVRDEESAPTLAATGEDPTDEGDGVLVWDGDENEWRAVELRHPGLSFFAGTREAALLGLVDVLATALAATLDDEQGLLRQLSEAEADVQAMRKKVNKQVLRAIEAEARATNAERRMEEREKELSRYMMALNTPTASQQEVARLREALAFAASCIKSGESWTPTCAEIIGGSLSSPHQSTGQGA